jgi:hypothetical protein
VASADVPFGRPQVYNLPEELPMRPSVSRHCLSIIRRCAVALALAVGLLCSVSDAVTAQVPGADDPSFEATLRHWLDDDEATALPALAALARDGNRAAQVLLALIDIAPPYQGPWLVGLPRAERLALMRAPGGLSGRSWMSVAAEDTPLARLWADRLAVTTGPETALAFARMGEDRAARETLLALAARQFRSFASVADDTAYPPELRFLVWREWAAAPGGRARAEAEIATLMPGDPQIVRFDDRPVTAAERDAWLAESRLAAPLRATCAALCPASGAGCIRAAFVLVGGHRGLATFGTPSATLIPPEVWDTSPRGRLALLRVAPARHGPADYRLAEAVAAEDACLAEALAVEAVRRPG